jgi:hypothetical protein
VRGKKGKKKTQQRKKAKVCWTNGQAMQENPVSLRDKNTDADTKKSIDSFEVGCWYQISSVLDTRDANDE